MMYVSKKLTAAILLSCLAGTAWLLPNCAHAKTSYTLKYGKDNFCQVDIYSSKDGTHKGSQQRNLMTAPKGMTSGKELNNILTSMEYIYNMIGPSKLGAPPIELHLLNGKTDNASASSPDDEDTGNTFLGNWFVNNSPTVDTTNYAAVITIEEATDNWYTDKFPVLPTNGCNADYFGTITHEMFHALGLAAYPQEEEGEYHWFTNLNKFESGLHDIYGNASEGDMPIQTISLSTYNSTPTPTGDSNFYVLKGSEVGSNSGIYYNKEGGYVDQVLNGALIVWPDEYGDKVPAVNGLPINGFEGNDFDCSHIELQNSLMSHQNYRNWCTFMEAEIALLQDLGYKIDRSKYFGKSIYNSNANVDITQNWSSSTNHGIGLHIYGSNNTVTQNATIDTKGNYGIGMRVDGVGNKLTVNNNVSAGGVGGIGLAVTYGKNHEITVTKDATISATNKDGIAVSFDFGSNELGDKSEYRGSYFVEKYDDGEWYQYAQSYVPDAIKGALVKDFTVSGTLEGKTAAIYISPNAWVEDIYLMGTSEIKGNIISDWDPLELLYQNRDSNGNIIDDTLTKIQPMYTNLYFLGTEGNENKTFSNSIFGNSIDLTVGNMVLNVTKSGTQAPMVFVHNVNVGAGEYTGTLNMGGWLNIAYKDGVINVAEGSTFTLNNNGAIIKYIDKDLTNRTNALINNNGSVNLNKGTLAFVPVTKYYDVKKDTKIKVLENEVGNDGKFGNIVVTNFKKDLAPVVKESKAKVMLLADADESNDETSYRVSNTLVVTPQQISEGNSEYIVLDFERDINADLDGEQQGFALLMEDDDCVEALVNNPVTGAAWKKVFTALDTVNDVASGIEDLQPKLYASSAQAVLQNHQLLNNLTMNGSLSYHERAAAKSGGGRGPRAEENAKTNSWRNIVIPFASYTDQHNGYNAYSNHNNGVLGAMERTLDNGLTMGYHMAINHQTTSSNGDRVKGEGYYLGAQANYAPAHWNDWQLFGSARVGVNKMRSHILERVHGIPIGTSDADWTGYSGSLLLGAGLDKQTGAVKGGPFAAIDYSFAHQPSINEGGTGLHTQLDSTTYDSLQTKLGYRLRTQPKALDNYDSTKWQAHAQVAWNHELLSNNGHVNYGYYGIDGSLRDTAGDYGKDSMNLEAGITFKTPKKLDVTLTCGSDIYRHGGHSVYGRANLEWKF